MARIAKPYNIIRRDNAKTFQFTLNPTCGLPSRVCAEWQRRSFSLLPNELSQYRNPKTKSAAEAAAVALIAYLKKAQSEGRALRPKAEDVTVGDWIERFTSIETSPRSGINAAKNRPYSYDTVDSYKGNFERHIKGDPICKLKMSEVEEEDILDYLTRFSLKKLADGQKAGGRRVFVVTVAFMRMTFNEYQRINHLSTNPFQFIILQGITLI